MFWVVVAVLYVVLAAVAAATTGRPSRRSSGPRGGCRRSSRGTWRGSPPSATSARGPSRAARAAPSAADRGRRASRRSRTARSRSGGRAQARLATGPLTWRPVKAPRGAHVRGRSRVGGGVGSSGWVHQWSTRRRWRRTRRAHSSPRGSSRRCGCRGRPASARRPGGGSAGRRRTSAPASGSGNRRPGRRRRGGSASSPQRPRVAGLGTHAEDVVDVSNPEAHEGAPERVGPGQVVVRLHLVEVAAGGDLLVEHHALDVEHRCALDERALYYARLAVELLNERPLEGPVDPAELRAAVNVGYASAVDLVVARHVQLRPEVRLLGEVGSGGHQRRPPDDLPSGSSPRASCRYIRPSSLIPVPRSRCTTA